MYTPDQIREKCTSYVARIRANEKGFSPTVNGLAIHIGMSKRALHDYRERDGYAEVLREVIHELEAWWEARLASANATGAIFWLKNFGWTDKTQTEISGSLETQKLPDEKIDERIAALMANPELMSTIKVGDK